MNIYAFKTKDGRYLAQMDEAIDATVGVPVYGAVNPKTDGNYYKDVCIAFNKHPRSFMSGASGWLKWLLEEAFPKGYAKMSEDFEFDKDGIKIVTFKEIMNKKKIETKSKNRKVICNYSGHEQCHSCSHNTPHLPNNLDDDIMCNCFGNCFGGECGAYEPSRKVRCQEIK